MGLGDFLGKNKDFLGLANPLVGGAVTWADALKGGDTGTNAALLAAGSQAQATSAAMTVADQAVRAVPGGSFIMDSVSRSWDTLFLTAAHAGAVGKQHDTVDWGAFVDRNNWAKAWNSWGSESHVSAGQILASRNFGFGTEDQVYTLDPFDAQDAKAIQNAASDTWAGQIGGAVTDLGLSMAAPGLGPATKVLNASREAKALSNIGEVGRVADRFHQVGTSEAKVTRVQDTWDVLRKRQQNPDSIIGRMAMTAEKTDQFHDIDSMRSYLAPMMENSSDATVTALADLWVQANKLPDVDLRNGVKINAMLAAHGSKAAREALIRDHPLLARNLEAQMGSPRGISLAEDLVNARQLGASDDSVNMILERNYGTAADKAELDALRTELDKAAIDAKDARDLVAQIRAEKPTTKGFDSQRLKETRAASIERVQFLSDQLRAARGELKAGKRYAAATANDAGGAALDPMLRASRQAGAADRTINDTLNAVTDANSGAKWQGRRVKETGVQRNWVEAEFKRAKADAKALGDAAPPELGGKLARLTKELDAAKETQDAAKLASARAKIVQAVRRADALGVPLDRQMLDRAKSLEDAAKADYRSGALTDMADVHASLGDARTRVADLEQRLAQAKADRDLFHSTPLPGFEEMGQWKADLSAARDLRKETAANRDWAAAFARQHRDMIEAKKAEMADARPGLNRANDLLNEIMLLGDDPAFMATGRIEPTALDSMKSQLRLLAGDEHLMRFGDGNTPLLVTRLASRAAKYAMAPVARGSISLVDVGLGSRQMSNALDRSGVFKPLETKAWRERLLATAPADRQLVVAQAQEEMLQRIAAKHFGSEFDTPEEALKHAREVVKQSVRVWGQGNQWVVKALDEQRGKGRIIYRTPDGHAVAVDEAMLQSQLADEAPFLDPEVFDRAIRSSKSDMARNLRQTGDAFLGLYDVGTMLWKHGALLRPGLAVRAGLDTELRAMALMNTAETVMAGMVGAANMVRNRRYGFIARKLFGDGDIAQTAIRRATIDTRQVRVDVGNGRKETFAFSRDADQRTRNQFAMTKGTNEPYRFFFQETMRHLARYKAERAKWDRYKADSPHWVTSYLEYAEQLLASPTGRWLADRINMPGSVDVTDLLKSKEFNREYMRVANPKGFSREVFAKQVFHEVEAMFHGNPDLVRATVDHRLTPKMVEDAFPRVARFDVPGPHQSAIDNSWQTRLQAVSNRMYRILLDKPDMWLSRNPTGTMLYRRHLMDEVASLRKTLGEGESVSPEMLRIADQRARTKAISTVRRTFFDTTRYTQMHEHVARIAPFFAAWEDAMVSWARLIHDDPTRLAKLSGAYNAAGTLNPYLPDPLLVDRDGKPLQRGEAHDGGAFIAVPFKVKGVQMRVRLQALNSIAQGETWWLPGFGPQATLGTTWLLGQMPQDVVLDLVGTDNPAGKAVLNSMFLDGQLPRTDVGSLAATPLPGWMRQISRDVFGDNFAMNVQRSANKQIADATKQGQSLSEPQLRAIYDHARKDARTAAIVRLVSGTGFGLTGTAVVDGQFYVDQMHQIEGMSPAELKKLGYNSPEEYFTHLYPEASDLDFNLSRNETGIVATVNAQKSSYQLRGVLKDHDPSIGWMVLGRANVDGSQDFSRTAYTMQQTSGSRTKLNADQVREEGMKSVGWSKYRAMRTQLDSLAKRDGVPLDSPILASIRRQYVDWLMTQNSAWARDWTERRDNFSFNLSQARQLSQDKRLANRSDFQAFKAYDEARKQLMTAAGVSTLTGTGAKSTAAKAVLTQLGERLAQQDIGFQQMWDRFLANEVEVADVSPAAAVG